MIGCFFVVCTSWGLCTLKNSIKYVIKIEFSHSHWGSFGVAKEIRSSAPGRQCAGRLGRRNQKAT